MELIDYLKNLNLLKDFKEEMSKRNLTLIGDYLGSKSHIKFPKSSIIFNSIVENNKNYLCLHPVESIEFFKKFKFNFPPYEKISQAISNFSQLTNVVKELYISISSSHILKEEDGSVI